MIFTEVLYAKPDKRKYSNRQDRREGNGQLIVHRVARDGGNHCPVGWVVYSPPYDLRHTDNVISVVSVLDL